VVDARLAERGCEGVRSYNLGFPGAASPTLFGLLEHLPVSREGGSNLVLVEPYSAIGPSLHRPGSPSARFAGVNFFELGLMQIWTQFLPERFADALLVKRLQSLGFDKQTAMRFRLTLDYLETNVVSALEIGTLHDWFMHRINQEEQDAKPEDVDSARGFKPFQEERVDSDPVSSEAKNRELVAQRVRNLVGGVIQRSANLPPLALSALEHRLVEAIPSHVVGARVKLLLPPVLDHEALAQSRAIKAHFRLTRPDRVLFLDPAHRPELQVAGAWFDTAHLSASGAEVYSRWIADRLCPNEASLDADGA